MARLSSVVAVLALASLLLAHTCVAKPSDQFEDDRFEQVKVGDAVSAFAKLGSPSSSESSSASSTSGSLDDKFKHELVENMRMVASDDDSSKDQELADALQSVKDSIVYKANNIKSDKRWVKEVTKIVDTYVSKARRVNAHIRSLQSEVKVLYRKKKQIENMIVQRKLEKKLQIANKDLETLQAALKNTQKKSAAFHKSQDSIKSTIGAMESELEALRGLKQKAASQSSGAHPSSSSSSSSLGSSLSSSSESSSLESSSHSSSSGSSSQ